jgi:hypothetical protein
MRNKDTSNRLQATSQKTEKNKQKLKDSFLLGLVVSLLLPPILMLIFFKIKYTTQASFIDPMFYEALWRSIERGFLNSTMIACIFPSMILFFILFKMEWWRAGRGLVLGIIPYFLLLLYLF